MSSSVSPLSRHQPLALRCRPDLIESTLRSQGETAFVVKDPVALKYFRLREAEAALLRLVDGNRSIADICDRLKFQFPAVTVDENQVHLAIQGFHRQGLLISNSINQGRVFEKRKKERDRKQIGQLFSSILAIRFPGVNPTSFLDFTYPLIKWIFHPLSVIICMVFLLSAVSIVLGNMEEFYSSLPKVSSFFAISNLPFLALTIFITKTVHELGHAFVCKHFGAECHSIGFMLLVLSPAAYCDTSDSWMIPSKRKRILIAAAGMFFELLLAAAATFIWWYTEPNWLHFFCMNLIIVSSVTTILFNANPLLRYDGYYILSDVLEIPNLAQKSRMALLSWLRQLALGLPKIKGEIVPNQQRILFVIYSIAAFFYRWFILAVIYWFLIVFFETNQVAAVGYLLVSVSLGWTLAQPARQLVKFFRVPGRMRQIKTPRLLATVTLLAVIAWFICLVPLKRQVAATFVVEPANFKNLFVETPGILRDVYVKPGDSVNRGELVAVLSNLDAESEVTDLKSRIAQLESEIELYKSSQVQNTTSALSFSSNVSEIQKLRLQMAQRMVQLDRLQIRTPRAGVILPAIDVENHNQAMAQNEKVDIFEPASLNAFLPSELPICAVADEGKFIAVAYFDQNSVKQFKVEQPAELLMDEYLDSPLTGRVKSIANEKTERIPSGLTRQFGGEIGTDLSIEGASPISPRFRVEIEFQSSLAKRTGMRGQAKIVVDNSTVAGRLYRLILKTIRFR